MEETKFFSKGKIIAIVAVFLIVVAIVTGIFIHRSKLIKEYKKLEITLQNTAINQLNRNRMKLKKKQWIDFDLTDLKSKIVNDYVDDCVGYVIVEADNTGESISSKVYISCKNLYETPDYGDRPEEKYKYKGKTQEEEDTEEPEITLFGESVITLEYGAKYKEPGATAKDVIDGDLTEKIKIKGKVDTKKAGTYTITYTVSDKSGNKAKATRKVIVKEKVEEEKKEPEVTTPEQKPETEKKPTTTPNPTPKPTPAKDTINPVISFYDNGAYQTICKGDRVNASVNGPYGYMARDNIDGDITSKVVVSGSTGNMYTVGTFTINYKVSDSSGNTTYATRNFSVKDCSAPVTRPTTEIVVSSVSLTPNDFSTGVGLSVQLYITIIPENATNKNVTYTSSNTSVATVSSTGVVSGKSKGDATITVQTANGLRATSIVHVR